MTTKTVTLTITTSRGFFGVQVDDEKECSIISGSPEQTAKLASKRLQEMLDDLNQEECKKWE